MRIPRSKLDAYAKSVPPAPAPIEPRLDPEAEAALLAARKPKDPTTEARRVRVLELLRRPAVPSAADAELIALLARREALPLASFRDRLAAHRCLAGIGALDPAPPLVARVAREIRTPPGDGSAFADKLLPPQVDPYKPEPGGSTSGY